MIVRSVISGACVRGYVVAVYGGAERFTAKQEAVAVVIYIVVLNKAVCCAVVGVNSVVVCAAHLLVGAVNFVILRYGVIYIVKLNRASTRAGAHIMLNKRTLYAGYSYSVAALFHTLLTDIVVLYNDICMRMPALVLLCKGFSCIVPILVCALASAPVFVGFLYRLYVERRNINLLVSVSLPLLYGYTAEGGVVYDIVFYRHIIEGYWLVICICVLRCFSDLNKSL